MPGAAIEALGIDFLLRKSREFRLYQSKSLKRSSSEGFVMPCGIAFFLAKPENAVLQALSRGFQAQREWKSIRLMDDLRVWIGTIAVQQQETMPDGFLLFHSSCCHPAC